MTDPELLKLIVVNLPNFAGLLLCIYLLWRIIQKLMDDDDDDQ